MAVKGVTFELTPAQGLDQRYKGELGGSENLSAFRIDPDGEGFLCDRGIEPWFNLGTSSFSFPPSSADAISWLGAKIDACFVWTKQTSETSYMMVEQDGNLYYLVGAKGSTAAADMFKDRITIDTARHIPKMNQSGTQFIPFGNRLLILNGVDKPIWFYGRSKWRDFGFTIPTPQCEVLEIEPDYLDGTTRLTTGVGSPSFSESSYIGLGDITEGDTNTYSYKMTFISDTGSESPMSTPTIMSWTIGSSSATHRKFGIFIKDLPIGPKGTVARRLYRTKNQRVSVSANAADANYFLVKQITDNSTSTFIDIVPDQTLVNQAPASSSSQVIDVSYQHGAAWMGRLWLAGGSPHPTKIIYSDSGLPEQFGAFSFFDVGNTKGGPITALQPYYNSLLVFRETSIEIIRITNNGLFTISTLSSTIGTTATKSIQLVPTVGIMFLSKDGFYSLSGGLDGGSIASIEKMSLKFGKEIQRINVSALAKAVSVYSEKEKEYWCHYPQTGQVIPTRGCCYHTINKEWSLRKANDRAYDYRWSFTAMTSDASGNIILGTKPTWRLGSGDSSPDVLNAIGELVHLQVWSGSPNWGQSYQLGVKGQNWTYNISAVPQQSNIWESAWIDFEDSSKKHRVFNVEAEVLSMGDNVLYLDYGVDHSSEWLAAGGVKQAKAETLFTTAEDAVLGPANATVSKNFFKIGTSPLKEPRILRLRWDVSTQLVDFFRFRLRSNGTPFQFLSLHLNFTSADILPLNTASRAKGQPT
jgi:hypothetical protein